MICGTQFIFIGLFKKLSWGKTLLFLGQPNRCLINLIFQSNDEGVYECRAYRKDDLIASSTVHVYADNHIPADVARVEIAAPTVRVVNKGDSIALDCVVQGRFKDI
jgi:hypothetical protein